MATETSEASSMDKLDLEENEDSELEWQLEEGIPQTDEPVIQKYFQGRDGLIAQEDKHRSGS